MRVGSGSAKRTARPPIGTPTGSHPGTRDRNVARAAVEAETSRFDGLNNEPANPPRQPALHRDKRGDGTPDGENHLSSDATRLA